MFSGMRTYSSLFGNVNFQCSEAQRLARHNLASSKCYTPRLANRYFVSSYSYFYISVSNPL